MYCKVQEKHHLCHENYLYPRCSCAVAVRSGKDVFMIDVCDSKFLIHFPFCGDKVLKVIRANDKYYKVFFFFIFFVTRCKFMLMLIMNINFKKMTTISKFYFLEIHIRCIEMIAFHFDNIFLGNYANRD